MLAIASTTATVVFWISIAGWFAGETAIFVLGRSVTAEGSDHDRGSVWPVLGGGLGAFILGLIIAAWLPFGSAGPARPALFWVGIVAIWAGIALRLWAVRTLGSFFQPVVTIQSEHRVITAGPYRRVRHPSYTGGLVTMAGIGAATGNLVSLAVLIVVPILGYLPRISVEERALAGSLGTEYTDYQKNSARLVPGVW
ncbi:MAG: isoprenylcysteine carboxylmethyltransferase family protein [Nocardia sp.]|nr:isoprenylcysteine carboxylmethyltransferase family protein [Nocardia sp.]